MVGWSSTSAWVTDALSTRSTAAEPHGNSVCSGPSLGTALRRTKSEYVLMGRPVNVTNPPGRAAGLPWKTFTTRPSALRSSASTEPLAPGKTTSAAENDTERPGSRTRSAVATVFLATATIWLFGTYADAAYDVVTV